MRGLQDFAGTWSLLRRIEDFGGDRPGTLTGEARFVPVPGGLDYQESGQLLLSGQAALAARQRHEWRTLPQNRIAVSFADGRPFHAFDPAAPQAAVRHDCFPDLYQGFYDLRRWPDWQVEWCVTGPRKNYRITTRYRAAVRD